MEDANHNATHNKNKNARELRSALQYAIIQICVTDDRKMGLQTSPQAIQALAELAFQYSQLVAADLDAFSTHANRPRTLAPADVLLMVRKNPSIQQRLEEYCQQLQQSNCQPKAAATKKRKSNSTDTVSVEQQQQQSRNRRLLQAETSSSDEGPSPTGTSTSNTAPRKRPAASKITTKSTTTNTSKPATTTKKKKDASLAGYPEIRLPPVEDSDDSSSSSSSDDDEERQRRTKTKTMTTSKPSASSKSAPGRPAPARSMRLLDDSDDDSVLPEVIPHKPQTLGVLENRSDDNNDDATADNDNGRAPHNKHQSQVMQIMANLSPDSPPSCGVEEDGNTSTSCMMETRREQQEDHAGIDVNKARVRGQVRPLILDLSSDEEAEF